MYEWVGCMITDNILIGIESCHDMCLHAPSQGRVALKLDMVKALTGLSDLAFELFC